MMAKQLPLALHWPKRFSYDSFIISDSNRAAVSQLERWPNWPQQTLILLGPQGCGKSHLAHAHASVANAEVFTPGGLDGIDWRAHPHVVIDGAPVLPDEEAALFHIINGVREEKGSLLITARTAPNAWPTQLADLKSRLAAMVSVSVDEPDDLLLKHILAQHFNDLGVLPAPSVIDYLATRIERSFTGALTCVEALNEAALADKVKISPALARKVMGW
ncbi:MAG: DnaA/Hda family protein [Pseudomonadota bacterium]